MITICPRCTTALEFDGQIGGLADCAQCGHTFQAAFAKARATALASIEAPPSKVLIEKTSKKYKAAQLFGLAAMLLAMPMAGMGTIYYSPGMIFFAGALFFGGMLEIMAVNAIIWWQHG
jgi:hypothetical protein